MSNHQIPADNERDDVCFLTSKEKSMHETLFRQEMCGINKEQGEQTAPASALGKLRTSYFNTQTTCVSQCQTEANDKPEIIWSAQQDYHG
jgi:hypothetical protein